MQNATTYADHYELATSRMGFLVRSLAERPSQAIKIAVDAAGEHAEQAVQAMFDAVMDRGYRMVLVQALNSPAPPQWVREKLQTFLYGERRRTATLLRAPLH
jgi:hypothetical protein